MKAHLGMDLDVSICWDAAVVVEGPELLQTIQAVEHLIVLRYRTASSKGKLHKSFDMCSARRLASQSVEPGYCNT